MIWDSFFDDEVGEGGQGYSIWKKVDSKTFQDPPASEIIFEGYLIKTDAKTNSQKERFFILTKEHLIYKKKKQVGNVKGYMDCKFMRVKIFQSAELTPETAKDVLKIRFVRNLKFCDLFARNPDEKMVWVNRLSKIMVRTDFHERFKVKRSLGEGSFAKVYLATRLEDNLEVAVKAFSKEALTKQSKGKQAIRNEIEILQELDQDNVLHLFEVQESKNSLYLICEYLSGGSLNDLLKRSEDYLSATTVLVIMQGILQGLAYLDSKSYIHRDLKPENIMLKGPEGPDMTSSNFKICDFGLATKVNTDSYLYKRCGTPGYVAPEIVKANSSDPNFKVTSKCDIFSAGIIMYLLLSSSMSNGQLEILHSTPTI